MRDALSSSQVGLSAEGTHQVGYACGVVGPQEGQVAGLPEMHLYCSELVLEIDFLYSGGLGHGFHLLHQWKAGGGVQVCKVNFCFSHNVCVVNFVSSVGIPCVFC